MSTNQIAQFISAISNAQQIRKFSITWPCSKSILEITKILKSEGYINYFQFCHLEKKIIVILKYSSNDKLKNTFTLVSQRFSKKDFWNFSTKVGLFILSTPLGIISDKEARILGVGGSVLFYIC